MGHLSFTAEFDCPSRKKTERPHAKERLAGVEPFDGWAVNVRCLDGVDIEALPVERICGSRIELEPPDEPWSRSMPKLAIRLAPERLTNPDLDLRYVLPRKLEEVTQGRLDHWLHPSAAKF